MRLSPLSVGLPATPSYKLDLFSANFEGKDYFSLVLRINISSWSFDLWASWFCLTHIYSSCILGCVLRAVLSCDQTDHLSCIYYPFKSKHAHPIRKFITTSVFRIISMCLSANKGRLFYASINQSWFKGVKTEARQSSRFWSGLWAPVWPLSWVHFLYSQRCV